MRAFRWQAAPAPRTSAAHGVDDSADAQHLCQRWERSSQPSSSVAVLHVMTTIDQHGDPEEQEFDTFLADARAKASSGAPATVTIRTLLRHVGGERRGTRVLRQIQGALDRHGLITEPSFASGWVDNRVQLKLVPDPATSPGSTTGSSDGDAIAAGEVSLTVRSLESATKGVTSVERNSDLLRARALMLRYDFSQLAVMSGPRQPMGAVSWESMALAAIRQPDFSLRDATIPAQVVDPDADLVALIPTIAEKGFVFVANPDRTLAGIVTTADLSLQFATLAGPFLLIGEIERRLRQTLATRFTVVDFAVVRDPAGTNRTIDSANDLTLGETLRLIENPSNWDQLCWPVERSEFINALNDVKDIRNEVMHFSPDPLSEAQKRSLLNFAGWLRAMDPSR
jgi:CBS domain-containing protein